MWLSIKAQGSMNVCEHQLSGFIRGVELIPELCAFHQNRAGVFWPGRAGLRTEIRQGGEGRDSTGGRFRFGMANPLRGRFEKLGKARKRINGQKAPRDQKAMARSLWSRPGSSLPGTVKPYLRRVRRTARLTQVAENAENPSTQA